MIEADYYISINGDEPLISPDNIRQAFPSEVISDRPFSRAFTVRCMIRQR